MYLRGQDGGWGRGAWGWRPVPANPRSQAGYAMAALLVAIAVMSLMLSVAMPAWRHQMTREREAELVFRGEQYVRAIELFQRKHPGTYPPTIDLLVSQRFLRKKYRDPMTEDGEFQILYGVQQQQNQSGSGPARGPGAVGPTGPGSGGPGGRFAPAVGLPSVPSGAGGSQIGGPQGAGISGVVSKSKEKSIRLYKGRNHYNEWQFILMGAGRPGGPGGVNQPGMGPGGMPRPGQPGRPGVPGGPGGIGPTGPRGPRGGERPFGQPPPPPPPRPGVIPLQ